MGVGREACAGDKQPHHLDTGPLRAASFAASLATSSDLVLIHL
jgi:hypothetical protein